MISYLIFVLVPLFAAQQCFCVSPEDPPTDDVTKNELKIICHYHLHTWYEPGYREYSPDVIDESQCTHIVYTDKIRYPELSANRSSLHDGKKLFYNRVPEFRKKGINVSISFFKFNGYEFARNLGDNIENRTRFVTALVGFMEENNFNGFDVAWLCRSCTKDNPRDLRYDGLFMDLMSELSEAFKPRNWSLSSFVSIQDNVVHDGFDVKKLSEYVDWMTVSPIDQSKNTSLFSPLYFYPGDPNQEVTVNWSVNYLIEKGVSSSKLVLPVTSMGLTYQLTSAQENGLNAPTDSISSGQFYKICDRVIKEGWTVVHHTDKRVGSYAYHDNEWTSYIDVEDARRKAEYIIKMNLGGGSIINLNNDDFEEK